MFVMGCSTEYARKIMYINLNLNSFALTHMQSCFRRESNTLYYHDVSNSFNICHLLTGISHYVYVEDHFHVEIICYITEGNTDSCEDVSANLWSVLDI